MGKLKTRSVHYCQLAQFRLVQREGLLQPPKGFFRVPDVAANLDPSRCGKLHCLKSTAFTTDCYRW
jgi:hypothetical protein